LASSRTTMTPMVLKALTSPATVMMLKCGDPLLSLVCSLI
jgi:hypothetical protein